MPETVTTADLITEARTRAARMRNASKLDTRERAQWMCAQARFIDQLADELERLTAKPQEVSDGR